MRLDSREALLKGGEDGKMVVPGESKKSWVVIAASRIDDDTAMPPKRKPGGPRGDGHGPGAGPGGPPISGAGNPGGPPPGGFGGPGARGFGPPPKPLTAEQVGLLRAWVDQGAKE
ncbi:MAG TPA: c-type cytochrome domain-containing protein [Verrucomicrobiae bacterium]|nr:c-type cytochrome domain-containing protein [Verrucomicrobiae bacterium]